MRIFVLYGWVARQVLFRYIEDGTCLLQVRLTNKSAVDVFSR